MTSQTSTDSQTAAALNAVTAPQGYTAGGATAGIKESGEPDLALLISDPPATATAVFTTNQTKAAPLHVSRAHVDGGVIRAVIVNSGNANCATGAQGRADAEEMTRLAAERAGCPAAQVFVNSTGIIGHYLPMDRIRAGVPAVELGPDGGSAFARAIMTTDSSRKEALAELQANGRTYRVGGCCKGAGMIHPNMATMLAFLTTDAPVERGLLQDRLQYATDRSFNMITVDGDTSTNDSVLLLANGAGGGDPIEAGDDDAIAALDAALAEVCQDLAKQIAAGGEGATKLIEMSVTGAGSWEDARDIARSAVKSVLLKAALSKGDPNWGRVLMAAGNAGVSFDLDAVRLWLGGTLLFEHGATTGIPEAEAAEAVAGDTVAIRLDLAAGHETATAWGCDLTEEYVRFNADYVT